MFQFFSTSQDPHLRRIKKKKAQSCKSATGMTSELKFMKRSVKCRVFLNPCRLVLKCSVSNVAVERFELLTVECLSVKCSVNM